MKIFVSLLFGLLFFTLADESVFAQHKKLTIILLRHAEKDVSENADSANPELSTEGKLRAQKLAEIISKFHPDAIFSTNLIRTRTTARPLASEEGRMISIYDPRSLDQFAEFLTSGKLKKIVVVGHSNTTPALVNLLVKQDKYESLDESVYNKIWVIKIRRKKTKPYKVIDKIIEYEDFSKKN